MKEGIAESKDSFEIYKTVFDESIIPMGIIEPISSGSTLDYCVQNANQSFWVISNLKNPNFPLPAITAFAFLKGFSNSLFHQFSQSPNGESTQILYQSQQIYYRLTLKKLVAKGFLFTIEDVTELQLKRIELSEKNRQLRESQEIAQLGYWIENHEMGNNFWSEQVYRILSLPFQSIEPSFTNYLQFVYHEDSTKVKESYQGAIDTKTGFEFTHRLQLDGGQFKYINLRCYTNYNSNGEPLQTIGILQDISAIEITKEELRKSESIFRSLFENAPIAIVLVNDSFKPIYANPQFSDITGYSMDEILKKGLKDFTYPADFENNTKQYNRLFNNELSSFSLTKRYIQKDGNIIWVKIIVSALKDTNNQTTTAIAMVQDISAEKKASEALLKSEYKYRTLIENANDGIGLFDMDFKPIIYNTALYNMLGYSLEDYLQIDHNKFELFHPDDMHLGQAALAAIKNNLPARIEAKLKNHTSGFQYFSISYIPVLHEEKPAILIFRRDISKRKKAEQQNEEYRLFLETIMENLPVMFFAKTTPDFRYLYWNHTAEQITGITADDAIGKTDLELQLSKQIAEKYFQEDEKLLKFKKKLESEHEFTNSMGEIKHFKTIKTIHQPQTGSPLILGLSVDITQLKEAEKQIEQSTQMLKEAQKIARLGYWEYDVEKDLFFDNTENRQILGIDKLQYFLNATQFKELIVFEDQDTVMNAFYKSISRNVSGEGIIRIHANNETKHIAINYKPIANNKKEVIKLRGTCLDITQIRRSELALRESEKRLRQAEHIAKVGYWDHNYITKNTFFSNEVWSILEMPLKKSEIRFSDFVDTIHPEDKIAVSVQFQKSNKNNEPFNFDFRIITRNQNVKFIKALGTFVKNPDGTLQRSIGTFQDVSDFRRNELDLIKKSDYLLQIQKLSKTGYIEISFQSDKVVFSNSMFDIMEITPSTQIKLSVYQEMIHPEDQEIIEKTFQNTIHNQSSHNIQYRIVTPQGKVKFVNEICHIKPSNQKGEDYATRIIQDISYIKEKEMELTRWLEIKKTTHIGSWEFNQTNQTYTLNPEACTILEFDETETSVRLDQWLGNIHPEDKFSVEIILNESFQNYKNFTLTYRIINPKNKTFKYIQDSSSFHKTANGPNYLIGTIRDITPFRQTELKLLEHHELLKAINENSLFITSIIQQNKHLYVNNRWCELMGIDSENAINKLDINQIYKPETTRLILEIFLQWGRYDIKEYRNEMSIKPLNAPEFKVEIYIKDIIFNNAPAFLVLGNPE